MNRPAPAAFESSSSSAKPAADQAVKNIRSGDYVGAMRALTEAAGMGELSDDQRQAIYDVITEVQIKVAKEAPGNSAEINDAIAALDAALTGRPLSTENPMEFMKPPTAGQQP